MPLLLLFRRGTPAAPVVGTKALMYARAGIMRAGASRADYYQPIVSCTIGGVRRETKLVVDTMVLSQHLNAEPDTLSVSCSGFTPIRGQEIVIGLGAIDNRIFGGHILRVKVSVSMKPAPIYQLDCIDYTWELGHKRVRGRQFIRTSAEQIIGSLLSDFAPTFSIYGRPFGLPATDFQSNHEETLVEAITRLCKMVDLDWYVDENRKVHLFATSEMSALSFTNTTQAIELAYADDLSQIRTRTTETGGSTSATVATPVGATSLAVDDTRLFGGAALIGGGGGASSIPMALVGANVISYTGRSVAHGPGFLTGIPDSGDLSIRYDIAQGESVRVFALDNNLGAQGSLATTLGAGHNGVIEHTMDDGSNGDAAAHAATLADLLRYATDSERQLTFKTYLKNYTLGRDILATVTTPLTISGVYQIYSVTWTTFPPSIATHTELNRQPLKAIEAGINRRGGVQLLGVLA